MRNWVTAKGDIDLEELGLRDIKTLVEGAAQDCTWAQASKNRRSYSDLNSTPLMTDAGHIGSLLWKRLFAGIEDRLGSVNCLLIEKIKAHLSLAAF